MAKKVKRSIQIEYKDGTTTELEIGKAVQLKGDSESAVAGRIYLERMNDGKWRLCYSEDVIADFAQVERFNVIREG